jgi:hypothetical protein
VGRQLLDSTGLCLLRVPDRSFSCGPACHCCVEGLWLGTGARIPVAPSYCLPERQHSGWGGGGAGRSVASIQYAAAGVANMGRRAQKTAGVEAVRCTWLVSCVRACTGDTRELSCCCCCRRMSVHMLWRAPCCCVTCAAPTVQCRRCCGVNQVSSRPLSMLAGRAHHTWQTGWAGLEGIVGQGTQCAAAWWLVWRWPVGQQLQRLLNAVDM